MSEEFSHLVGRSVTRADAVDLHRWRAYHVFFGLDPEATRPLAFHWLLFNELCRELRQDGHAVRMDPFTELPFSRRMWAGGEIIWNEFLAPGTQVTRTTTIRRAELKSGGSGSFLLCSVEHAIQANGRQLVQERQDIVFLRQDSRPGSAPIRKATIEPGWSRPERAGSIALFRYSALTLNAHRIHYDEPYTRGVEGYPGLVVQGPLLASQLMHEAAQRRSPEIPRRLSYRSVAPLYVDEPYQMVGRRADAAEELAVLGPDSGLRMTAVMTFGETLAGGP